MGTSEGNRLETDRMRGAVLSSGSLRARLPWTRVVQLTEQVEAVVVLVADVDPAISTRLARAVLDFQEQLLGGEGTKVTGTSNGNRPESDLMPAAGDPSGPSLPHPPWAVVVDLAQQLDAERAKRTEFDPAIAGRLARAVLDFHEHLRSAVPKTGGRT